MLIASADTCVSGLATITTTINIASDDMYIRLTHQDNTDHTVFASSFISINDDTPSTPRIHVDNSVLDKKHPVKNDHLHVVTLLNVAKIISLEKDFSDLSLAASILLNTVNYNAINGDLKNSLKSLGSSPFSSYLIKVLYWYSIRKKINKTKYSAVMDIREINRSLAKEGFLINPSCTKEQSRNIAKLMLLSGK